MIHFFSLAHIESLILAYKYLIIFPISIVEGPIVTVIAAFLSSLGYLNIFMVYLVVVLGDLVGDTILYYIGYNAKGVGEKDRVFGISKQIIEDIKVRFRENSGKAILTGKWTHSLSFAFLITAGLARVRYWKFIFFSFIATLVKSLFFVLIGYYFGKSYSTISNYIDKISLGLGIFLIGLLAAGIYIYKKPKK